MAADDTRAIVKLPEDVVCRIAAGEVVQRPASALKEMLENAIDAESTVIKVTVAEGGLKLVRISDNGKGIGRCDLPLLCERFATSKLRDFEDLRRVTTFGFRGEALASISHVARLGVVTRTNGSRCAYRAVYRDGRLAEGPMACAGENGTTMTVEDLFHNSGTRRRAFTKSPSEQYTHIVKVVSAYAVHYGGQCGFTLVKKGAVGEDINTIKATSPEDCIRLLYAPSKASRLARLGPIASTTRQSSGSLEDQEPFAYQLEGYVAADGAVGVLLLFVNDRLVESGAIKRAVSEELATGAAKSPFVYVAIRVPPSQLDINVHPTKREVHLLHEDEIVRALHSLLASARNELDSDRTVGPLEPIESGEEVQKRNTALEGASNDNTKWSSAKAVRTNSRDQTLDRFCADVPGGFAFAADKMRFEETLCGYDSIQGLIASMVEQPELARKLRKAVLVGSCERYLLLQLGLHLAALDSVLFGTELFRQLAIRRFGRTTALMLEPPYLTIADSVTDQEVDAACTILDSNSDMLDEYFNLRFRNGHLVKMPELLPGHVPTPEALPKLVATLALQVDYTSELPCFTAVANALAACYATPPPVDYDDPNPHQRREYYYHNFLFPALRSSYAFRPPSHLQAAVLPLTDITCLYRTFERC